MCGGGCDDLLISNATLRVAAARVLLLLAESDAEEDQLITTFCKSLTQPPTATALPGNYTNIPLPRKRWCEDTSALDMQLDGAGWIVIMTGAGTKCLDAPMYER